MSERLVFREATLTSGEMIDIAIEDGVIVEVTAAGQAAGDRTMDCSGLYVSSGWIDLHVHAFPDFDPYGDDIDEIGVKQGVATIVDAGSCGADRIGDLAARREKATTTVFALLNVSKIGLLRVDELSDLTWLDREYALRAVQGNPDFIVGWKARMSGSVVLDNGIEPLRIAKKLSEATDLPLMVHIGSAPPRIEDILPLLDKEDVVTHYLNGKSNHLFDANGCPIPELTSAIERGVLLDVGHGTASFSFKVAEAAKRSGVRFDTISSDIYRGNRLYGPVRSLAHVMSKFLLLGYPLSEVIDAVTVRAAEWLKKPELGRIQVGDKANLTLFALNDQSMTFVDSEGDKRIGNHQIEAKGVYVNGRFVKCEIRFETRH
ncbi:amidohydrolase/deacetylase family metallohydrolase [Cohnella endophytica]|uniref:Amidohydrolase/deacetylase family metallohydrolase n=1 Tax=Cohnella endophytica TaxID=2419778 RepID=A0A494Y021_9BACL|nr:amidohydrolase/deacetylase family metallohydrolase [Cohnella endophytica]RKP55599.1 amidohydrolase/deacetylase family metallohydrolase [Cohnella endophytica]